MTGRVPGAIAAALNLRGTPDQPTMIMRIAAPRRKQLLVLDNCEHLRAPCAKVALEQGDMARAAPLLGGT